MDLRLAFDGWGTGLSILILGSIFQLFLLWRSGTFNFLKNRNDEDLDHHRYWAVSDTFWTINNLNATKICHHNNHKSNLEHGLDVLSMHAKEGKLPKTEKAIKYRKSLNDIKDIVLKEVGFGWKELKHRGIDSSQGESI